MQVSRVQLGLYPESDLEKTREKDGFGKHVDLRGMHWGMDTDQPV